MPNLPDVSPAELAKLLEGPQPPRLLDVREPAEFISDLGHVAHSELIPLGTVPNHAAKFAGEARDVIVICRSGKRAAQAADFLSKQGVKTRVLTGGMIAWNEAKLPISRDPK